MSRIVKVIEATSFDGLYMFSLFDIIMRTRKYYIELKSTVGMII